MKSDVMDTLNFLEMNSMFHFFTGSKRNNVNGIFPGFFLMISIIFPLNSGESMEVVRFTEKLFTYVSVTLPRSIIFLTLNPYGEVFPF